VRILVTGGGGVLGQATIPLLRAEGHEINAPAPTQLDLFDAVAVLHAVGGTEGVLHLATRIPPREQCTAQPALRLHAARGRRRARPRCGARTAERPVQRLPRRRAHLERAPQTARLAARAVRGLAHGRDLRPRSVRFVRKRVEAVSGSGAGGGLRSFGRGRRPPQGCAARGGRSARHVACALERPATRPRARERPRARTPLRPS
jgi:hypothetical protein